ncbi:MAG: isochorismatase family protein [Nanoarchaeota archaeon]|nr:isochorismatase family protein [Nanoarchaeota archaeon]
MKAFFDEDTQKDFINPDGALYVPGAETIKARLGKLTRYALSNGIPILGSVDRHFGTEEWTPYENELQKWGGLFPDHCMDGTDGQKKIDETSIDTIFIENAAPDGLIRTYSQDELEKIIGTGKGVIFEKQGHSVFPEVAGGNAYIDQFLTYVGVTEVILYGVATDYCVKEAALGFRRRGIDVSVVQDAVKAVDPTTEKAALQELEDAGVLFTTTDLVMGGAAP